MSTYGKGCMFPGCREPAEVGDRCRDHSGMSIMGIDSIPGSVTRPTEEEREIAELKAEVERLREDDVRRKEQFERAKRAFVADLAGIRATLDASLRRELDANERIATLTAERDSALAKLAAIEGTLPPPGPRCAYEPYCPRKGMKDADP